MCCKQFLINQRTESKSSLGCKVPNTKQRDGINFVIFFILNSNIFLQKGMNLYKNRNNRFTVISIFYNTLYRYIKSFDDKTTIVLQIPSSRSHRCYSLGILGSCKKDCLEI